MAIKERKTHRFREAGKVSVPELCIFPAVVEPDMDSDYEASFVLSSKSPQHPIVLIVQPKWKKTADSATEIGFEFLHSPGTKNLAQYIQDLSEAAES